MLPNLADLLPNKHEKMYIPNLPIVQKETQKDLTVKEVPGIYE